MGNQLKEKKETTNVQARGGIIINDYYISMTFKNKCIFVNSECDRCLKFEGL